MKSLVIIRGAGIAILAMAVGSAVAAMTTPEARICDPVRLSQVSRLYLDLMEAVQGPAITLPATDSVCVETDPVDGQEGTARNWYFEAGSCQRNYDPNPGAFVTGAAYGAQHISAENPEDLRELQRKISELKKAVDSEVLPPLAKLDVQQFAWEFYLGLRLFRSEELDLLRPLIDELANLIEASPFSEKDVEGLAGNLAPLRTSDLPLDPTLLTRLEKRDDRVLEVVDRSQMHLGLTSGRVLGRVFLTADDEEGAKKLQRLVCDAPNTELHGFPWVDEVCGAATRGQPFRRMNSIHYEVPEIRGLLLLYFNVFGEGLQIKPTSLVAAWREYAVAGVLDADMGFLDAAQRFRFGSAEYRKNLSWSCEMSPRYEWLPPEHPTAFGLFDVNPVASGGMPLVTTHRANCLQCHRHQITALTVMTAGEHRVLSTPFYFPNESEYVSGGLAYFDKKMKDWLSAP